MSKWLNRFKEKSLKLSGLRTDSIDTMESYKTIITSMSTLSVRDLEVLKNKDIKIDDETANNSIRMKSTNISKMSKLLSDSVDILREENAEVTIMSTLSVHNPKDFKNSDLNKTELKVPLAFQNNPQPATDAGSSVLAFKMGMIRTVNIIMMHGGKYSHMTFYDIQRQAINAKTLEIFTC